MNLNFKFLIKVILFLSLVFFITGCDDGNIDNSNFVTVKEETFEADINKFHLEWNSGIIHIYKSEGNEVTISERAKEDFLERNMYTYEVTDDTLNIIDPNYNEPVIMLAHDLDIYIPDKRYTEINIDGTSVELDFEDFSADTLTLNTDATEHHISGTFTNIYSDFTSGEIEYTFYGTPNEIKLDGYVSNGMMSLPDITGFKLSQQLESSEITNEFEEDHTYGDGKCFISLIFNQSNFTMKK